MKNIEKFKELVYYSGSRKLTKEEVESKDDKDKKETVIKTVYSLSGEDERIKQLIDIALLASGQLKGESLAKFVNRSVSLL